MAAHGTCIVCSQDSATGFFLFDGTPDLVVAALLLVGVPRDRAESEASSEPGDLRVFLCRSCAETKGVIFPPTLTFPWYSLKRM